MDMDPKWTSRAHKLRGCGEIVVLTKQEHNHRGGGLLNTPRTKPDASTMTRRCLRLWNLVLAETTYHYVPTKNTKFEEKSSDHREAKS